MVATLWEIDDRRSVDLVADFYGRLARGASSAVALTDAKRNMIAAGGPPWVWAAFTLVGSPDVQAVDGSGTSSVGLVVLAWIVLMAITVVIGWRIVTVQPGTRAGRL